MLRAVQAVATLAIACAAGRTVSEGARRVATCGAVARMAFNAMDTATLNLQYSPSRWVKRVPAEVAVQQHMDDAVTLTAQAVTACASVERDVRYGPGPRCLLDLYLPSAAPPKAVLAYLHGGYWQGLGKEHGGHMCGVMARAGVATASLDYDLCPDVTISEQVGQVTEAVRYVRSRFAGVPLVLGGHSAGAHLAVMAYYRLLLANDAAGVAGLFLLSGVYDVRPVRLTPSVNTNNVLRLDTEADADAVSPARLAVVAVGEQESDEFKRQSAEFAAQLRSLGAEVDELVIPGRDHFDVAERLAVDDDRLTQRLLLLCSKLRNLAT